MKKFCITILILIVVLVVALASFSAMGKIDLLELKSKFCGNEELKIDQTETVVEEIKKIAEFTSACYYEEFVIHKSKPVTGNYVTKMLKTKPEVVIIAKGVVRAGVDLSKVGNEDIKVKNDTLSISLPKPEVFDVIINPSNYEIFSEDGDWSHDEISKIISDGKTTLEKNALKEGIISKAGDLSQKKLESLFKNMGFNVVEINIKE